MCYRCKQEGHYARVCPRAANERATETKMEKMKTLIRSMTPTEQLQFKGFVTKAEKLRSLVKTMTTAERSKFGEFVFETQKKMPTIPLSRETSPHANQTITASPPSRETGPHTNQMLSQALKKSAKIPEQCEECGKEHPTRICIDKFRRLRGLKRRSEPRPTPTIDMSDDESSGSDTLHESEDEDEMPQSKSVTFDLPPKDDEHDALSEVFKTLKIDKSESDGDNDDDNDNVDTQQPTS